jgi:dTDP-4-dehydrorhamnose reductase
MQLMQRKILVFGANGQVGRALVSGAPRLTVGFNRSSADICTDDAVRRKLRDHLPLAIVNAAAYTAVDRAELEPKEALRVNRDGAAVLAAVASLADVPFIHISTDYVFDGTKRTPYCEDDPVAPLGAYGLSKAEGERAVREICAKHVILRTSWVYSPYGTNFVRTMLRLARESQELRIVDDQLGCPTAAADIASTILSIVERATAEDFSAWGTYHYCGRDPVTWYRFAGLIFEAAARYGQKAPRLVQISTAQYPTPARRPAYSVLSTEKLKRTFDIAGSPLSESLGGCIDILLRAQV